MARSNTLKAFALDDFESRSGSATSILRTVAGLYLRHVPHRVPRSRVLALTTAAGLGQGAAQTAITRLVDRGLLDLHEDGQISISAPAQAMFERGTRRIFTPRQMQDGDTWTLVTYSLPETLRSIRHQLRKHFTQLGGGLVASGLWIFPQYLHSEILDVLESLQIRESATLFSTGVPEFPTNATDAARAWWDLSKLSALHTDFIATASQLDTTATDTSHSYRCYVRLIDAWRVIPYLDPGLPPQMLPTDWPGQQSRELFLEISAAHREAALSHATQLLEVATPPLSAI